MYCCGQERRRGAWIKYAIFIPVAIAAGVFVFGSIVMLLWNALLPAVIGVHTITFWQALGILVLSKILFGGFSGHHNHHRSHHGRHEKWMHLTPEQREKMKAEWKNRCECSEKTE